MIFLYRAQLIRLSASNQYEPAAIHAKKVHRRIHYIYTCVYIGSYVSNF